ncbi:MAG: SGNH/GDSL hydrolase family protein [Verrucomicrobiota bacterium]
MRIRHILFIGLTACSLGLAQTPGQKPGDPGLTVCKPTKAPKPPKAVLKRGDRLAICGDSITEQKMYSRLMEDYLTMCVPELNVTVRQYGWGGERAPGFLARMTNDCLRFKPTIATTCYGMNDHEYRPYEDRIGQTYRTNSDAIVKSFKANGAKVIQGSPGCVGKVPGWSKHPEYKLSDLNSNLCNLRNIGIEIARKDKAGFADVFWPMLTSGVEAQARYGADYAIAGHDGVHPGWAGHTVMAYAFLKALGLDGEIGTFVVDLKKGKLTASKGHDPVSANAGVFEIRSSRYPFCACIPPGQTKATYPVCGEDDPAKDNSIRSAMTLIPFNADLNRLMLKVKNAKAGSYKVTWGTGSKTYTSKQLAQGINLVEEFPSNPFCDAFAKVDAAVAAKQAFETKQIKKDFRSPEAKADMEAVAAATEKEREPLAAAIKAAFVPVSHTIRIEAQ